MILFQKHVEEGRLEQTSVLDGVCLRVTCSRTIKTRINRSRYSRQTRTRALTQTCTYTNRHRHTCIHARPRVRTLTSARADVTRHPTERQKERGSIQKASSPSSCNMFGTQNSVSCQRQSMQNIIHSVSSVPSLSLAEVPTMAFH